MPVEKATVEANPFCGVIVTVAVAEVPGAIVILGGAAVNVNEGAAVTVTEIVGLLDKLSFVRFDRDRVDARSSRFARGNCHCTCSGSWR